jgi:DNA repair protein RadC
MQNNIKINDIPKNERPMEKLLMYGAEDLSNAELLAVLLRSGTRGENIVSLSTRLLYDVGGLDGLLYINIEEIKKLKGIKDVKACQIIAMVELFKRFRTLKSQKDNFKVSSPKDISMLLVNEMNNLNQEVLKVILLNTKNIVIGIKDVFKGSLNSSIVHPREIFKYAHLESAYSIIVMHNHPSGDSTPSKEDEKTTKTLMEIGKLMSIPIVDHIIFGKDNYFSFYEYLNK